MSKLVLDRDSSEGHGGRGSSRGTSLRWSTPASFQLNSHLVLILDFSSHRIIISIFNLFISISSSQKFIYAILLSFPDHVLP
jgi:hypothetical protein